MDGDENESKPIIGVKPLNLVDEERNRLDYNRAMELCDAIQRHCAEEKPWPTEWDDELCYITGQLWQRIEEGGVADRC